MTATSSPTTGSAHDAIIVGGGHNGMVCAYYLARRGRKVLVLERREVVGGAAVTEEFHPGFRNSMAAYTVSLLAPDVIREMDLPRHGLTCVLRKASNFLPTEDGRYLLTGRGAEADRAEISKFSPRDADAYVKYGERLDRIVPALRNILHATPPSPKGGFMDILNAAQLAFQMNKLDIEGQRDLLDLFARSAGEWLDEWFESDPIKAVLGFDSIVGNFASPYTPGSAYVLLHHVFGEVNGVAGAWGHAIGGMGAITQAMARACREAGVEIRTEAEVAEVLVENGAAVGVRMADGTTHRAHKVIANVHPKVLYERLLDPKALPDTFRNRIANYRSGSGTFRMNVALSRLPDFTCLPGTGDHLTAGIIMAPSLAYMDTAYDDARKLGWSRRPIVEMLIPSPLDDSLAPPGQHVASLFCQQFSPTLPDGRSWDDHRDEVADLVIDTVDSYAPGFKDSVLGRIAFTPLDLERRFGLIGGDIFHGKLSLDQMFSARPMLGHGAYRGPLKGLYMCGAGSHPGGGVTGIPGRNAAREVLHDR